MDRAFLPPFGRVRGGAQERHNLGMQDEVDRETEHQLGDAVEFYTVLSCLDHPAQLIGYYVGRP